MPSSVSMSSLIAALFFQYPTQVLDIVSIARTVGGLLHHYHHLAVWEFVDGSGGEPGAHVSDEDYRVGKRVDRSLVP